MLGFVCIDLFTLETSCVARACRLISLGFTHCERLQPVLIKGFTRCKELSTGALMQVLDNREPALLLDEKAVTYPGFSHGMAGSAGASRELAPALTDEDVLSAVMAASESI